MRILLPQQVYVGLLSKNVNTYLHFWFHSANVSSWIGVVKTYIKLDPYYTP